MSIPSRVPEKVRMIPPTTATQFVSALSEVVDWGQKFTGVDEYRKRTNSMGAGINIAILDSGVALEHPDLAPNVVGEINFTGDDRPIHPHGTHVAGIIAAAADGVGVIGVAPEAKIHSVRVLDSDGLSPSDYRHVIAGLEWVRDNCHIDIINISLGAHSPPPDRLLSIIRELVHRGVIIVAASGNDGGNRICYPARFAECIGVAALDKEGNIARFSNISDDLDLVAPGVDIYSTWFNGGYGYAKESGTSMAAPFVVGLIALMLSYHRNGNEHGTPITNHIEAITHLQAFQSGILISGLNRDIGVGIVNASPVVARATSRRSIKSYANEVPGWRLHLYSAMDNMLRRILIGSGG